MGLSDGSLRWDEVRLWRGVGLREGRVGLGLFWGCKAGGWWLVGRVGGAMGGWKDLEMGNARDEREVRLRHGGEIVGS